MEGILHPSALERQLQEVAEALTLGDLGALHPVVISRRQYGRMSYPSCLSLLVRTQRAPLDRGRLL